MEACNAQKKEERQQLELNEEHNSSLCRLGEEIESARGDVTIEENKDRAVQQQLASKEAEGQKAKGKYSAAIKEIKLRQAMGAGSYGTVQRNHLPGARIDMLKTLEWLGGIDSIQILTDFYDRDSTLNLLAGRTKLNGGK